MGRNKTKVTKSQRKKDKVLNRRQIRKKTNKENRNKWKNNVKEFNEQLNQLGLTIREMGGDGNCLFRSVADQIEGIEDNQFLYREKAVAYIEEHKDFFAPFIDDDDTFEEYVADMKKDGAWGGNIEIQAMSQYFKINIVIHMLDAAAYVIENHDMKENKTIHLSYHMGEHYNSVRLLGDDGHEPAKQIPNSKDPIPDLKKIMINQNDKDKKKGKKMGQVYEKFDVFLRKLASTSWTNLVIIMLLGILLAVFLKIYLESPLIIAKKILTKTWKK